MPGQDDHGHDPWQQVHRELYDELSHGQVQPQSTALDFIVGFYVAQVVLDPRLRVHERSSPSVLKDWDTCVFNNLGSGVSLDPALDSVVVELSAPHVSLGTMATGRALQRTSRSSPEHKNSSDLG